MADDSAKSILEDDLVFSDDSSSDDSAKSESDTSGADDSAKSKSDTGIQWPTIPQNLTQIPQRADDSAKNGVSDVSDSGIMPPTIPRNQHQKTTVLS